MQSFSYIRHSWLLVLSLALVLAVVTAGCADDKKGAPPPPGTVVVPTDDGTSNHFAGNHKWIGPFIVTNRSVYEVFLKDHNVCDPHGFIGWTWGTWDCDNYNSLFASVHLSSLEMPTIGAAQIYSKYTDPYSGFQFVYLRPSIFHGEFKYIDANSGIELYRRGNDGTYTWNALVRYRLENSLPTDEDGVMHLKMYYRNQLMGEAEIKRQ